MTDDELFSAAAANMVTKRGVPATYTYTGGGTPSSLYAVLGTQLDLQPIGTPDTFVTADQQLVVLDKSDLTRDPKRNDTVTITETLKVYTVQGTLADDGFLVTVSVVE